MELKIGDSCTLKATKSTPETAVVIVQLGKDTALVKADFNDSLARVPVSRLIKEA